MTKRASIGCTRLISSVASAHTITITVHVETLVSYSLASSRAFVAQGQPQLHKRLSLANEKLKANHGFGHSLHFRLPTVVDNPGLLGICAEA